MGFKNVDQLPNKTNMQILRRIKQLGIKKENPFITKMSLVQDALNDDVIISKQNQYYKDVNLYEWCIYNRKNFSQEELKIINQVIPNRKQKIAIKMVDITTKHIYVYPSKSSVIKALCNEFGISQKEGSIKDAIKRRLSDGVAVPYKERFMFYYATDEEVEKYLKENKVN